jgi:glycosyltransferase involved in cell wall biosynthesis
VKILISRISDGTRGGAEVSAFDQVKLLHGMGHDVFYVSNMPDLLSKARQLGIKTGTLPWIQLYKPPLRYLLYWLLLPWFTLKAINLVLRFKPDIVNPHSREDQIVFTLTKFIHKKPVIWKDAGDLRYQLRKNRRNPFGKFYEALLRRAIRRADFIYLLTKEDAKNVCDQMGEDLMGKLAGIPSSILYEEYSTNAKPQPRPADKIIVGYAGRISEIKGLQYLIEAARTIDRDDVEFWLYGDGDYKGSLTKQANGMNNVKFFEFTNEIPSFLNTFDIFVQPARLEGWGRNVKEAMYFGLPVLGSNSGGVAKQIDHNKTGLLFEPMNPADLAKQLERLLDDKALRERLGRAAQEKAKKDGDFSDIVKKKILPIYERFAGHD